MEKVASLRQKWRLIELLNTIRFILLTRYVIEHLQNQLIMADCFCFQHISAVAPVNKNLSILVVYWPVQHKQNITVQLYFSRK